MELDAIMLISESERRNNLGLYNLCVEDNSFDAVNKFGYLGNMIDNEGPINTTGYKQEIWHIMLIVHY